ncbi:trans-resveratrol di-O-methyltransferase-like [Humulus lupulus]|uniref:trans-resveratrol di-O-methyltransferase-like n=1 Tax=Humulus lupulus TaxID=3486 RepID=UPI002B409BA9|nr:trans-resveratrol di-O-methyltransferase-like [Humulus lupulus]
MGSQGINSSELSQGQAHLYKHMLSYATPMSLKCAIQLGIPNIIHNNGQGQGQPITLPELVSALQLAPAQTGFLYRLMRLLVHSDLFTAKKVISQNEEEVDAYGLTPSSRLLLTNNGNNEVTSLCPYVLAVLDPSTVTSFHFLGSWFQQKDATPSPHTSPPVSLVPPPPIHTPSRLTSAPPSTIISTSPTPLANIHFLLNTTQIHYNAKLV